MTDEEDEGVPLTTDAVRRFADPDKLRGYDDLIADRPPDRSRPRPPPGRLYTPRRSLYGYTDLSDPDLTRKWQEWREREVQAWCDVFEDFKAKLIRGELIATGYVTPFSLESERQVIPAAKWKELQPDLRRSEARWGELVVRDIRIRLAEAPAAEQVSSGERQKAGPASDPLETGGPGRRSFIPQAEVEMRLMAERGELSGSLKKDSAIIHGRLAEKFPGHKVSAAKTIRNRLNKLYREITHE